MEGVETGYHWSNGWFFFRLPDGSVRIRKHFNADLMTAVIAECVIPADEWASIVASVGCGGETAVSWQAARSFHMGVERES